MDVFMKLPLTDTITVQNPFGIIGMILLCETNTLYVSTLAGSKRNERGAIYAIDSETGKIIDKITATDAMGLGITYATGKRQLFFGTGRNSEIKSVTLTNNGKFSGGPRFALSIEGLGPRGDDKVRKIRTDQFGNLLIHGMEFNFNLIAPREKQETIYQFSYNEEERKWISR